MKPKTKPKTKMTAVHLPDAFKEKLRKQARGNGRSLSSEIRIILENRETK
jgi:plasmid stability protein